MLFASTATNISTRDQEADAKCNSDNDLFGHVDDFTSGQPKLAFV